MIPHECTHFEFATSGHDLISSLQIKNHLATRLERRCQIDAGAGFTIEPLSGFPGLDAGGDRDRDLPCGV
jgi:hypothetical protein